MRLLYKIYWYLIGRHIWYYRNTSYWYYPMRYCSHEGCEVRSRFPRFKIGKENKRLWKINLDLGWSNDGEKFICPRHGNNRNITK